MLFLFSLFFSLLFRRHAFNVILLPAQRATMPNSQGGVLGQVLFQNGSETGTSVCGTVASCIESQMERALASCCWVNLAGAWPEVGAISRGRSQAIPCGFYNCFFLLFLPAPSLLLICVSLFFRGHAFNMILHPARAQPGRTAKEGTSFGEAFGEAPFQNGSQGVLRGEAQGQVVLKVRWNGL